MQEALDQSSAAFIFNKENDVVSFNNKYQSYNNPSTFMNL